MKKASILVLLWVLLIQAVAQQTPQFSQYMFNQFGINPAVVGSKDCFETHLGYRLQWLGFEGAPASVYAAGFGTLPKKKNPHNYKHGLGIIVEQDRLGSTTVSRAHGAYAIHMQVGRDMYVGYGAYAGIQLYQLNLTPVLQPFDAGDPALSSHDASMIVPEIGPGVWLYNDDFYAGVTIRQLLMNKIKNLGLDSQLAHHVSITGGKRFKSKTYPDITYIPSALLKYAYSSVPSLDLNMLVDYKNVIALGASYRTTDAVVAMARFNIKGVFSVGYSFDYVTSKIRHAGLNSHEISLSIRTCPSTDNKGEMFCPAYQ